MWTNDVDLYAYNIMICLTKNGYRMRQLHIFLSNFKTYFGTSVSV